MKKTIRLTESDLTRLVKRVIEEQSTTQKIDYNVLEKFLNAIDEGGSGYTSRWVLDPANPDKRSGSVKLTGKEAVVRMNYVNKPLVWSLVVNGKKQNGAIFQIFSVNGKLYYQSQNPTKSGQQNTTGYEELTPKTVGSAIQRFNLSVSL
jgi:adenine specific DNA methylase Mod